ncbi:MAG: 3-isopropylmalate dehydratase [bacterium]|nr:3-isopropylmalate dehydratase [bacterium]
MSNTIRGRAYVVGDNVDTDQIIPAQYLALVPTIPEEYERLGTHALSGLPTEQYPARLVEPDSAAAPYRVIIAGRNFGCGSSREHAPIALGAGGIQAVVADSFARIFFRNCIATGELYPLESKARLVGQVQTGDEVEIDLEAATLRHVGSGARHPLQPSGETGQVIAAGGLFAYARQTGLVAGASDAP